MKKMEKNRIEIEYGIKIEIEKINNMEIKYIIKGRCNYFESHEKYLEGMRKTNN